MKFRFLFNALAFIFFFCVFSEIYGQSNKQVKKWLIVKKIDNKTGSDRKERISRLVIIANDGSERFYRQTKKLVEKNTPRVLAIYVDVTSFELGERIFGQGKRALFLLISHKDAVADFLTSLIK